MKMLVLSSAGLYPPSKRADVLTRKLALGILLQALRDVTCHSTKREKEQWRQDALEWFASHDVGPGSLDWVCSVLQIEAARFRDWVNVHGSPGSDPRNHRSFLLHLAHGL